MNKENCLWELLYLKDNLWESDTASKRIQLGRLLANQCSTDEDITDIVVPIPETAILIGQGYSLESGIPLIYAVHKKRPKIRTLFIKNRDEVMKDIFFVIPELVKDKRVTLIDETIISGASISITIGLLRKAGVKEIKTAVVAPIRKKCFKEDFIKSWTTIRHVPDYTKHLQVDSFCSLSPSVLKNFADCIQCFEGE